MRQIKNNKSKIEKKKFRKEAYYKYSEIKRLRHYDDLKEM